MQKARRHPNKSGLRPLVSAWFQVLFTPLPGVLFTFPSQYWFTIGLSVVFSLTGWSRQFQTGFLVSRLTQDTANSNQYYVYKAFTPYGPTFQMVPLPLILVCRSPTTPYLPKQTWFGLLPFRSPLLRESLLFYSPPLT